MSVTRYVVPCQGHGAAIVTTIAAQYGPISTLHPMKMQLIKNTVQANSTLHHP